MGGCTFYDRAKGATAKNAFDKVVADARYENGHGGYTGTIAEKSEFVMIEAPAGAEPMDYAQQLISDDDPRISNKWGPAGCIALGDEWWLFFGWASS